MIIENNISLKDFNTLQIPVFAKYFVRITSIEDVFEFFNSDVGKAEKHYILNGGANILFTQDFDGVILKLENLGKTILSDYVDESDNHYAIVECAGGENWSNFVEWICGCGLCGLENLIDIPGNVGTAPVSNIGAYGTEVSDYIYEVEGIDLKTLEHKVYKKTDCEFAYRTSIFKHKLKENFLVWKVRFKLPYFNEKYHLNLDYADVQRMIIERGLKITTPLEVALIIREIRANKLPDWHKIGTAGSFFANPIISLEQRSSLESIFPDLSHHDYFDRNGDKKIKLSAGQLIDLCGLKGWRMVNGKAGTYDKHALILVNQGGTANDVLEAMHFIQSSVFDKFGVNLEPEVVLV